MLFKKLPKTSHLLILANVFSIAGFPVLGQVVPENPKKIFCIGNSITAGAKTADPKTESYPAVLQKLLAKTGYTNYKVRNLGIGGATIIKFGKPNLWPDLDSIKKYIPDIVIIKAGTNETVGSPRFNWEHNDDFEKDYTEYLMAIRKINPNCKIIICSPLDIFPNTPGLSVERRQNLLERRPRIWELRSRVKQLAKKNNVLFMDVTNFFKHHQNFITRGDGVHPNAKGYHFLATKIFKYLKHKKIINK